MNSVTATTAQSYPDRARSLGELLTSQAEEAEQLGHLTGPVIEALHQGGLTRMLLPRSVQGAEVDPGTYLRAIIELARADGSAAWNVFVANSSALIAAFLPAESAEQIFADPRALIAWGPPDAQIAEACDGGYRVQGQWGFASGCCHATWMGAHCRVREADGTLRLGPNGRPLVRSLLFPADQAELIDDWHPIGLRATGSRSYRVSDAFVPERMSSTREAPDDHREPGPLYAFTQQGLYAVGVAGVALGLANAMLEAFVSLAKTKTPRGLVRHATSPSVQAQVAKATAALESAETWLTQVLDVLYREAAHVTSIDVPARARLRLACSNAIAHSVEVAAQVYRLAGVDAIFPDRPFERRFRDINTVSQQIQSRAAHFEATGAILLGVYPETFY